MKKILSFFLLFGSIASNVYSQCTADQTCPFDSLLCTSNHSPACVGVPFASVGTIAVPSSFTDQSTGTVYPVRTLKITNITGLPTGITYQCNPSTCTINGGSRGCVLISGTANTPGTYITATYITVTVTVGTCPFCVGVPVNDTLAGTFVGQAKDCAGVCGGTAAIDNCGICSGGTTGKLPNCDDGDACTHDACNGQGGCTHTPATVTISGKIQTEINVAIPGVTVNLSGSQTMSMVTASDGLYSFVVSKCGNYTVTPSKANDVSTNNGITTTDITLIRRQVLGTYLNSPYKVIAADANNSSTVTTGDIPPTRIVVLSNTAKFPPSSSRLWEFVNSNQLFSGPPYNPFPFTKTRTYTNLTTNQSNQNFIGVKLGDVNNSWSAGIP